MSKEIYRLGSWFKAVVNHFFRLRLMASKQQDRKLFVVTPRHLGLPPGLSYDDVEDLLEALEGPLHK